MADDADSVTLAVRIVMSPTALEGRRTAIGTGYRPLIIVRPTDVEPVLIGLCQLTIDHPIPPGATGEGWLEFAPAVSALVRRLLPVGSRFNMAEGAQTFAEAEVLAIGP